MAVAETWQEPGDPWHSPSRVSWGPPAEAPCPSPEASSMSPSATPAWGLPGGIRTGPPPSWVPAVPGSPPAPGCLQPSCHSLLCLAGCPVTQKVPRRGMWACPAPTAPVSPAVGRGPSTPRAGGRRCYFGPHLVLCMETPFRSVLLGLWLLDPGVEEIGVAGNSKIRQPHGLSHPVS